MIKFIVKTTENTEKKKYKKKKNEQIETEKQINLMEIMRSVQVVGKSYHLKFFN